MRNGRPLFASALLLVPTAGLHADWPMLHGNAQHTGFVPAELKPPFRLAWVREFADERIGTAVEPIVGAGKVFVSTHAGNLYALRAATGEPLWRFEANGPILHSPAFADGLVVVASTDGYLCALDAASGELRWNRFVAHGGFSASPLIAEGKVFIGARAGVFVAVDLRAGELLWQHDDGASNVPIRQTAAFVDGAVFVTGEDLRLRRFSAEKNSSYQTSTSQALPGQTARDYYPMIVKQDGQTFVVVRTNPILNMGQRIGRDRTLLCRNAGVDDSGWQKLDAWTKSEAARGTPELWEKEQQAIEQYLTTNRDAQSFFVFPAGAVLQERSVAPVLWIGGCQSVGAMPASTGDGRLLTFYRSAYGNWNHGVAPLVALGLLDLKANQIDPLFHQQGQQPAWNCFWGTTDESQNFAVAGTTVLIVHQGALSGFDLKENRLFPIHGERDTYGGFRSPAWARNEWHGPARSGVAVDGNRVFWQSGSRVLCVVSGEPGAPASITSTAARQVRGHTAPPAPDLPRQQLFDRLHGVLRELLSTNWAPLFVEPGLAGREFFFDDGGEVLEALAWAYPHLTRDLQNAVNKRLNDDWLRNASFARATNYSLTAGKPREWSEVPINYRTRLGSERLPNSFGNVYSIWLYAERCSGFGRVLPLWPTITNTYEDFKKLNWHLDPVRGDLFANRYLASLIGFARLARWAGNAPLAADAQARANETAEALAGWWRGAAERGTLTSFKGSAELDPFINKGDGISFAIAPHRHKVALFQDLTPEVAALVKTNAPEAVAKVWETFSLLDRTWPLVGEERQVHFGENFVDPPDLALGGFKALAWLRNGSAEELAKKVDLPFCRADLYYITKLALALEAR